MKLHERSLTVPLVPDAAERLGIGRKGAYSAARDGRIKALRLGNRLRVPIAELDRLLSPGEESTAATDPRERELF